MCSHKIPFTFKDVRDLDFYFMIPPKYNDNRYYLENEIPENGSLDDLIRKPVLKDKLPSPTMMVSNEYTTRLDEVNRIPVIDQLFVDHMNSETIKSPVVLGLCNEIEYSGNILFVDADVKLPKQDVRPGFINMKIRTYFKKNLTLYTNDAKSILSTRYDHDRGVINGMGVDFFLRVDENIPHGEDKHLACYGPLNAYKSCTAKIKVVRKRFNHNNATYTLMGAIETELNDLITLPIYGPKSVCHIPFKRLNIIYWYLRGKYVDSFTGCKRNLVFRIAFRYTLIAKSDDSLYNGRRIQCNIECEDSILGYQFVECHDALMKFYQHQYVVQCSKISPLFERSCNLKDNIGNRLTENQLIFLNSLQHIHSGYKEDADTNGNEQISSQLVEFMRMSAIRLYLEQIPDKQLAVAYANPLNENLIKCYTNDTEEIEKYKNYQINDIVNFKYYNDDDVSE